MNKPKFRSVFLSDVHLGTPGCKAEELSDFLKHIECEYLFLVGDIIDIWAVRQRKGRYWPSDHNTVIRRILKLAKDGTKVIYIPGNHDDYLRQFVDEQFGNIKICQNYIHTLSSGKRVFILHGDEFDLLVRSKPWLWKFGSFMYGGLMFTNRQINRLRRRLGLKEWSFSSYVKRKVKSIATYTSNYKQVLTQKSHLDKYEADAILCGHIHIPSVDVGGNYYNCGDWVENKTAILELPSGNLSLMYYDEYIDQIKNYKK